MSFWLGWPMDSCSKRNQANVLDGIRPYSSRSLSDVIVVQSVMQLHTQLCTENRPFSVFVYV